MGIVGNGSIKSRWERPAEWDGIARDPAPILARSDELIKALEWIESKQQTKDVI